VQAIQGLVNVAIIVLTMVWLYRMPILDEWAASGDVALEELVGHVVIHELGHHFGWSDEEMDVLQDGEE